MTYLKQLFLVCLCIFAVSSVYASVGVKACRGLYVDQSIKSFSNIDKTSNLDASEKLYQAVQATYNQGLHSSIFLRPFLKHKIGKMIDKFRNKTNKVLDDSLGFDLVEDNNIDVYRKFKNIKMHVSETQDEVSRSSFSILSWLKPWLSYLDLPAAEQSKLINQLGDSYLGLQTLLLLNLRSEKLEQTLVQIENYDAFLSRDILVLEARRMVLRMDFIQDTSVQASVREQAESVDQKIVKLILQIKVLRKVLSASQSVMQQELLVAHRFRSLYFSSTPISNSDNYLQAKDLFQMYLQQANTFENETAKMPEPEQRVLRKLIRTLGR